MGFKKIAEQKHCNYPCKKCKNLAIVGKDIYIQKNEDNTWVSCADLECFKSQGGTVEEKKSFGGGKSFTSSKFPITEATRIYNMAEELLKTFKKSREGKEISIAEEIVFIESMVRTLSGNFKP